MKFLEMVNILDGLHVLKLKLIVKALYLIAFPNIDFAIKKVKGHSSSRVFHLAKVGKLLSSLDFYTHPSSCLVFFSASTCNNLTSLTLLACSFHLLLFHFERSLNCKESERFAFRFEIFNSNCFFHYYCGCFQF